MHSIALMFIILINYKFAKIVTVYSSYNHCSRQQMNKTLNYLIVYIVQMIMGRECNEAP